MRLPKRSVPITLIYKSGVKVHLRVRKFDISGTMDNKRFEWEVGKFGRKWPLLIGVEEVVGVYQGRV